MRIDVKENYMNYANHLHAVKRIAFLVDDDKKTSLIHWSYFNRTALAGHEIIAVRPMDRILEGTLNMSVNAVETDELYSMLQAAHVDALIVFSDAFHDTESVPSKMLMRAASLGLIVAPNEKSADIFANGLRTEQSIHQPRASQAV